MNRELLNHWVDLVLKEHYDYIPSLRESTETLNESFIPEDRETIINSFKGDVITEKFAPTEGFLMMAYTIMNEMFFDNLLPQYLDFVVKTYRGKSFVGCAAYTFNRYEKTVNATRITLNAVFKRTIHDWLETVLHEMIHVCDYQTHAEHFIGYESKFYDAHGKWFLDYGKQFDKYGFHVQQYCKEELSINTDDNRVKRNMNSSLFIRLDGFKKDGKETIAKISERNKQKYIDMISQVVDIGRLKGLTKLVFMKSENPNIVRLSDLRMRDKHSTVRFYLFTDEFKQKYGPFTEVGSSELRRYSLAEDKDETDFDDMNRIDDEYARKMYDNIKGVINVEKNGDDEYEVTIE